ncbi:MAG: squalene/phytoene synthase family protein [Hyphomicrobium sp.]|jgi:phytoene synthase|nr:squalene/phytoene synthase family protein [Hyphomicrobium sp.]
MSERSAIVAIDRAEVARAARDLAYDDYLSALLAPRDGQDDLIAVAALFGELARIPLTVSDATLGEIRLQWWRDALSSTARTGHPVADAAAALAPRLNAPLIDVVSPALEAYAAELYAEPFHSNEAFLAYVTAVPNCAFALRASILGTSDVLSDPIVTDTARTLGLVRTCVRMPQLLAKGRTPLSAEDLPAETADGGHESALRTALSHQIRQAADDWAGLRPRLRSAKPDLRRVLLPAALSGPYLHAIQRVDRDVLRDVGDPSPLVCATRLWLAARLGRF